MKSWSRVKFYSNSQQNFHTLKDKSRVGIIFVYARDYNVVNGL